MNLTAGRQSMLTDPLCNQLMVLWMPCYNLCKIQANTEN